MKIFLIQRDKGRRQ